MGREKKGEKLHERRPGTRRRTRLFLFSTMADACECVCSYQWAMRRLMQILNQAQNYCTDDGCNDGPGHGQNGGDGGNNNTNTMMMMFFMFFALVMFMMRPADRNRQGDEKPSGSNNGNHPPPPPDVST